MRFAAWKHPFCLGAMITPYFLQVNLSWFSLAVEWMRPPGCTCGEDDCEEKEKNE